MGTPDYPCLYQINTRVWLTHGEDDQRAALAKLIQHRHRLQSKLPKVGEAIEI